MKTEIDKELEKLWAKANQVSFHNEDELTSYNGKLYHYTNLAGLTGILQSQKLWGTEFSYLNDASEIRYGLDLIECKLLNFAEGKDSWVNEFVDMAMDSLKTIDNMEIYIACFCENGDLLSQWKGYSEFGKGFSIGLDAGQLSRFKRKFPFVHIDIRKVVYDRDTQSEIIEELIESFYLEAKELLKKAPKESEKIIRNAGLALASPLEMNLLRFKHSSFKEEREWRAIYTNSAQIEQEKKAPSFRTTPTDIVPYVELDISPSAQKDTWFLPISEIIVGSMINYDKASKSIKLIYRGMNIEVPKLSKSKIPLQ